MLFLIRREGAGLLVDQTEGPDRLTILGNERCSAIEADALLGIEFIRIEPWIGLCVFDDGDRILEYGERADRVFSVEAHSWH